MAVLTAAAFLGDGVLLAPGAAAGDLSSLVVQPAPSSRRSCCCHDDDPDPLAEFKALLVAGGGELEQLQLLSRS